MWRKRTFRGSTVKKLMAHARKPQGRKKLGVTRFKEGRAKGKTATKRKFQKGQTGPFSNGEKRERRKRA